ncbi:hypothetical protein LCGC14_1721970 [marine sediment metagenome]|uniref:Uncharacterized protein n=1 Tax=marine sediment metagenome TaxID=412755 RepID=A0A0F9HC88_9ZZZZ
MKKARKYTIYTPDHLADKLEKAYNALMDIDCNLSRLFQCLLDSIIDVVKFILKQGKNFRHYDWYLTIHDKETGQLYSTYTMKGLRR